MRIIHLKFPLDQKARDLMMGAPSRVTERQLKDLRLRIVEEK
jgi:aspartyl-tRNA synthetase